MKRGLTTANAIIVAVIVIGSIFAINLFSELSGIDLNSSKSITGNSVTSLGNNKYRFISDNNNEVDKGDEKRTLDIAGKHIEFALGWGVNGFKYVGVSDDSKTVYGKVGNIPITINGLDISWTNFQYLYTSNGGSNGLRIDYIIKPTVNPQNDIFKDLGNNIYTLKTDAVIGKPNFSTTVKLILVTSKAVTISDFYDTGPYSSYGFIRRNIVFIPINSQKFITTSKGTVSIRYIKGYCSTNKYGRETCSSADLEIKPIATSVKCIDSDNGNIVNKFGTTSYLAGIGQPSQEVSFEKRGDYCICCGKTGASSIIVEQICVDGKMTTPKGYGVDCPKGCSNGACIV